VRSFLCSEDAKKPFHLQLRNRRAGFVLGLDSERAGDLDEPLLAGDRGQHQPTITAIRAPQDVTGSNPKSKLVDSACFISFTSGQTSLRFSWNPDSVHYVWFDQLKKDTSRI
jgi:hypothetical protein